MDIPLTTEAITFTPAHYTERPAEERRTYRVAVADLPLRLAIQKATLEEAGEPVGDEDLAEIMREVAERVITSDDERADACNTVESWLLEDEPRRHALLRGEPLKTSPEEDAAHRKLSRRFARYVKILSGRSEVLRMALVQKMAHGRIQHALTLSFCLEDWSGPGLPPYKRIGKRVPMELLEHAFERGDAWTALDANLIWLEAWRAMIVTPQEKKSSNSP